MTSRWSRCVLAASLAGFWLGIAAPVHAAEEVDLLLVLAVDISNSMDPEEQELQRGGFIEAFRSPLVHQAIARGALGRIAVTYAEWAASWEQKVLEPWTVIDGPEAAIRFADRLATHPTRRGPRTSISGAIDLGAKLIAGSGFESARRVIDISGDGANNQGRSALAARDDALAQGLTINGLPIMLKQALGWWDVANLDLYYRDCIIGGQGAFMVPVRERDQFKQAIKTKIILEIAGAPDLPATVVPAQQSQGSRANQANCGATETRREGFGP